MPADMLRRILKTPVAYMDCKKLLVVNMGVRSSKRGYQASIHRGPLSNVLLNVETIEREKLRILGR